MLIALGMWACLILGVVFWFKLTMAGHILLGILVAIFFFVMVFVIFRFDTPENKAMVSAIQQDKKRKKLQGGYRCPNCGEMSGHRIGTISKSVSIGITGLASDKIGKTYRCSKCNYIW